MKRKKLIKRIYQINNIKRAYIKQIDRLNKIYQKTVNSYENGFKSLNNKISVKEKIIKGLEGELLETQKKLKESMTDKYRVRKIKPALGRQKQTMKIRSGYIEGKIMSKIKEEL